MKMDLTAGAANQLLVSHYNGMSCSMQEETSLPSYGPMMALMTAEQLDLDKKCEQQQGVPAASTHFMHDYYSDAYPVTVLQGDNSRLPQELSYEQLAMASCVQAPAVDILACAQVDQFTHQGHGDEDDDLEEEGELSLRRMHVQPGVPAAAARTVISRKSERPKTRVCHGNAAVLSSHEVSSLDDIVESGDIAAGHVDIKSAAKEEIAIITDQSCNASSIVDTNDQGRIRERIAAHPEYCRLVLAYISCRKVGAPPDVARRLDELSQEYERSPELLSMVSKEAAAPDPELDHFMKAYCHALQHYEEELSKPFNEAMAFLQKVELQISQLVMTSGTSTTLPGNEGSMSIVVHGDEKGQWQLGEQTLAQGGELGEVEEEIGEEDQDEEEEEGGGEVLDFAESMEAAATACDNNNMMMMAQEQQAAEEKQLKEQLLRKYRGYITTLKHEFMKKKKKGKLPKDARQRLLDWWHQHYKWPYPSETEKVTLAEATGLDQKQINNWFINQRKRHWKPSDQDMRYVMVNGQDPPMQDTSTCKLDQLT
ncbi:hypothetical protein GOP47_0021997 [Adiantum capillus-veneris]|uniref:Uncharacterized protein n=1 Tax=Adiantum capillus-veneris TaxID=13818 RepID=A0A9D4U952_ADICA|nr:hypothetical protein GOP47_0021997 [Adiantum capillus-veneris]